MRRAHSGWVQPTTAGDIARLETRGFRARDEEECLSATGMGAAVCCYEAVSRDDHETYTIYADDEPVGIFGSIALVGMGIEPGVGCAWFLATDGLYSIKKAFLKQCPLWMDHVQRHYPLVINYIHPNNKAGIKWAKWMGWDFHGLETYGVLGEKFLKVTRSAKPCAR